MTKKRSLFTISLILICLALTAVAGAKDATEDKVKAKAEAKKFTKEEMAEHIKQTLENVDEVLNKIPEIKAEQDAAGNRVYKHNGVALENMDEVGLRKLFSKVQNEAANINTARLVKQLETIRQAQAASQAAQRAATRVVTPPSVPKTPTVYTPPKPPSVPSAAAQQTRAPAQPPTPPRR